MFDRSSSKQTLDLDADTGEVVHQEGAGYHGFTVNPRFSVGKAADPVVGFATPEGTRRYAERNRSIVDRSNFKSIPLLKGDTDTLTLSKLVYGTAAGPGAPSEDYRQYNSLKYAILSGGMNHIDTGHSFRQHRAELTIGKLLTTLFEKYGVEREELFINSKQGAVGMNAYEEAPAQLIARELIDSTELEATDFARGGRYSLHPHFLDYSLNQSLEKLNLRTIDCAILQNPFEAAFLGYTPEEAGHSTSARHQRYLYRLARAFQFYEQAVQDGRIRSYGISCHDSLITAQEAGLRVKDADGVVDEATGEVVRKWSTRRTEYEIQQICEVEEAARRVGGENHHFRFVQAPFNLGEPNLLLEKRAQKLSRGSEETDSLMEVCGQLGLNVLGARAFRGGVLALAPLPPALGTQEPAARLL